MLFKFSQKKIVLDCFTTKEYNSIINKNAPITFLDKYHKLINTREKFKRCPFHMGK